MLEQLALRVWPDLKPSGITVLQPGEYIRLSGISRLDHQALSQGRVKVRYTAVDPVWDDPSSPEGMVVQLPKLIFGTGNGSAKMHTCR